MSNFLVRLLELIKMQLYMSVINIIPVRPLCKPVGLDGHCTLQYSVHHILTRWQAKRHYASFS